MSNGVAAENGVRAAVAALRGGRLVGLPTETVYGLAADATNPVAVAAIFVAKGRPRFNPLIVHVASAAQVPDIASMGPLAARLARAFWPGPLTLVLPRRPQAAVVDLVTAGLESIAVRVPAHPVARAVLDALGRPLAAPSANRSGHVSATTAGHVVADLGAAVDCVLDAGPSPVGIESTIIDLRLGKARLLRAGGLDRRDLEKIIGEPFAAAVSGGAATPVAPGLLASHYAPAAHMRLNATSVVAGEALLAFGSHAPHGAENAVVVVNLSLSGDLTEAATNLFSGLRQLDRQAAAIAVAPIPDHGLGEAINDRLRRAAIRP